jgi:hypothetical protein
MEEIPMKNKRLIFIIIAVFILTITMQQISIISLKKKQGGVYKYNFDTLSRNVKWTREYLEGTAPLTKDQTDSYFWKFNEYLSFAALLPSSSAISMYIDIIHVNLSRISQAITNNESKNSIESLRKQTLDLTMQLEKALDLIDKSCNNNNLKYYDLDKPNNKMMKDINKNLLDYLNKNNIH